ncbi:LIM zinc-binding protein [Oscillochloris trichoides DG-6]|uniref:LIM zinc-binding protein n=1 Tax=Oscillochloris trichoides DG-6 TaxID=765420 RepID=E1IIE0_9CHLR|nr:protein DA1 [Oscillochloris trichoides]EFO79015.1 LIM zinc-binding protein [Oscillochloris trichoides DG-6]
MPRPEPTTCASCGEALGAVFFGLIDRPERYCPDCIASRPRCATCGAPLGNQHWSLHDGRRQCAACHATAIYDPHIAEQIFHQTVAALINQFGLRLNVGVAFRVVDAPTMAQIRGQGGQLTAEGADILGLYQRAGHLRTIYMLYGLPKLTFRTTVAHEYAHAWQTEFCPLLQDELLREGFAEWVAYHHLRWIGCDLAAQRMINAPHPYRPALEHVLGLELRLGAAGVIEYLKRAE